MYRGLAADIFFFFNDTATTEIYTLSLHDALPIYGMQVRSNVLRNMGGAFRVTATSEETVCPRWPLTGMPLGTRSLQKRSEEHTSELQSQSNLVCRLLLEKKKRNFSSPAVLSDTAD